MVGLGETWMELLQVMDDLKRRGNIDTLTIGQYLQPSTNHLPISATIIPMNSWSWPTRASTGLQVGGVRPLVR